MARKMALFAIGLVVLALAGCGEKDHRPRFGEIDQHRLDNASNDQDNWLGYGHGYAEQRFSGLTDISDKSVGKLGLAWSVELDTARGQEATPIVVDGVMYFSTAWDHVYAVDAATGQKFWEFDPRNNGAKAAEACCDVVNRGVAIYKGKVFVATLDGRLIALDARTGKPVWSTLTVDPDKPYTITMAPRVARGKVFIGNSGAEIGTRGYISAYDVDSGKLVWRFYNVPGDPSKGPDHAASDDVLKKIARPTWFGDKYWKLGGGGTVWDSVVYDGQLNQLLFGTGNGTPWNRKYRSEGKGDNLFTSSIVAVDPDTGKYKWHYQVNPGDSWDFDADQQLMLADLKIDGKDRKVVMQASKNGFFYVIDRTDGKLISAEPFAPQNWADHIDLKTGRPVERPGIRYGNKPAMILPSGIGAHAWMPMSYSPKTGLVYIPAMEYPLIYGNAEPFEVHPDRWNTGVSFQDPPPIPGMPKTVEGRRAALAAMIRGELVAWDPVTQKARWVVKRDWPWNGGTLATGGNLVFQGTVHGDFEAYAADNGKKLWSFKTPTAFMAGPVTYRVNGVQYVAVLGGYGGSMGVASDWHFNNDKMPNGRIYAFKLNGTAKLPPYTPVPRPKPQPTAETFTPEQIATGNKFYFTYCSICHTGPVTPDLPRSALVGSKQAWAQVVIGGALSDAGMASFAAYLTPEQADDIRAFVNEQAKDLLKQEQAGASATGARPRNPKASQ